MDVVWLWSKALFLLVASDRQGTPRTSLSALPPEGMLTFHPDPGLPLQLHRARLEETAALFSFYSSCRELQSWLEEQTALFQTLQPQGDNLEVTQLKCEVSR